MSPMSCHDTADRKLHRAAISMHHHDGDQDDDHPHGMIIDTVLHRMTPLWVWVISSLNLEDGLPDDVCKAYKGWTCAMPCASARDFWESPGIVLGTRPASGRNYIFMQHNFLSTNLGSVQTFTNKYRRF